MAGESDVRCVWLATMWSRSLLSSTRTSQSKTDKDLQDIALTAELRPAFLRAKQAAGIQDVPCTDCHILGAIALKPIQRFDHRGCDSLGDAIASQLKHWTVLAGRALDGFALLFEVIDTVILQQPLIWNTIAGRRGGSFVSPLEAGQESRFRREMPGNTTSVFQYPFSQVLRLPFPYVTMILSKTWQRILVPDLPCAWNHDQYEASQGRKFSCGLVGHGHKWERCWPALKRFGKRPALQDVEDQAKKIRKIDIVHSEPDIWGLAECLASLGCGAPVPEDEWRGFLAGLRFQYAESVLNASRRHAYVAGGKPSFAFRVGHLVEVMLCAMFLKNEDTLGQALQTAACVLLPATLASAWIKKLREDPSRYLPSSAILSQRRAALDMGFALLQQSQIQEALRQGACFYAMTDSSPQGGRDYEITVLDMILNADARDLMFQVHAWRQLLNSLWHTFYQVCCCHVCWDASRKHAFFAVIA